MTESENENDHFDLDHFDHSLSYKLFFPMRWKGMHTSFCVFFKKYLIFSPFLLRAQWILRNFGQFCANRQQKA